MEEEEEKERRHVKVGIYPSQNPNSIEEPCLFFKKMCLTVEK